MARTATMMKMAAFIKSRQVVDSSSFVNTSFQAIHSGIIAIIAAIDTLIEI